MNKREVASLACKFLGIYIFIQGISWGVSALTYTLNNPDQKQIGGIVAGISLLIFGIILWFVSDGIAALITKGKTGDGKASSGIKASELQHIAFTVLGLYLIANAIPRIVSYFTSVSMMFFKPSKVKILLDCLGLVAPIIIGLIIFFGAKGLVKLSSRNPEKSA